MKSGPVPVLMYHHVADDREVTPRQFERHLQYLKEKGYTTPTLAGLLRTLAGNGDGGRQVLITFDDGYADNWICAWPLLKKYGFRAVVFATTARLGSGAPRPTLADGAASPDTLTDERGPGGFLNWRELAAMTDSGVFEAGSHTHTHRDFVKRSEYSDLAWELEESARLIKEHTGVRPVSIGWPWGHHSKSWEPAVRKAGYALAFTTVTGVNKPGCDPLYLKRIKVSRGDIAWFRNRLFLHTLPLVSDVYGKFYGLDRKLRRRPR
jgi:peptidoglycan/xylan/chitin deacetylase (PgdA/CDA1 family)